MMVFVPGLVGQARLSAITPPVLVMERLAGTSSGNCGTAGGAVTVSWPNWARVQLILVNNRNPLSEPLWPRRLLLLASLPRPSRRPVELPRAPPTGGHTAEDVADPHLAGVRGLLGMPACGSSGRTGQPATRSSHVYLTVDV